ncbi:hypothetical protein DPMN_065386 [Dreissena polymorpha]|uniref:Uncharacterized protein n=1 Tax=Dreissena polymorpha TaxID=45954 RepID=A0A9D4BS72_DREPO|nr:hypothetical protein DPMN_065386 [Dreissena polymorpha]
MLFILCHKRLYTILFDWLQFDRRSVTPNTLENRIREFHYKCSASRPTLETATERYVRGLTLQICLPKPSEGQEENNKIFK